MNPWLVTLTALIVLILVIGFLLWWYVLPPPLDLPGPARVLRSADTSASGPVSRAGEPDSDDQWAAELHAINQLGKLGDLTRPVHHLTHYEIEHLIRQLAIPDWLPPRLLERAAAEVNGQGELFAV